MMRLKSNAKDYWLLILFFLIAINSKGQSLKINFDFTSADLIINALKTKKPFNSELELKIRNNDEISAVVKKFQRRWKTLSVDTLIKDINYINSGDKSDWQDYFWLKFINDNLKRNDSLLNQIKTHTTIIQDILKDNLKKYLVPFADNEMVVTVHFIMLGGDGVFYK